MGGLKTFMLNGYYYWMIIRSMVHIMMNKPITIKYPVLIFSL